ncbi:M23 family metallopeptidase [Polycladospora coralii]|uniref:M23 family metallopeptidase n=1 Tax=Polycladospora coralii TaxID=2771432 RepID=UPI0020BD6C8F|nr:M23 family metallopeptidase [Polycladospora coralii]
MVQSIKIMLRVSLVCTLFFGAMFVGTNTTAEASTNFAWPCCSSSNVTQGFGGSHYGIDIAQGGTVAIKAAAKGTVSRSYFSSSYGEVVFIKHTINGKNYETVYAHMRSGSRTVSPGDSVFQGQRIGYMGNTGDSSGQHLHFELHSPSWNNSKSYRLNPLSYLGSGSDVPGGNGQWDEVGDPVEFKFQSPVRKSTGGDVGFELISGPEGYYTVWEYDPDNPDDFVAKIYLEHGVTYNVKDINKFVDGTNNTAEFYLKKDHNTSTYAKVQVYD